jgi:predicted dehydrogenase
MSDPVPTDLDWELWLGVAPQRPFVNELYLPYQWRRWKDFGGGTLGDMGCHLMDPIFTALDITTVTTVRSTGPANYEETFAPNGRVDYEFAATERTAGPLTLSWAEKVAPLTAAQKHLPKGAGLPMQGSILLGEKGMMVIPHIGYAQIFRDGEVVHDKVTGIGGATHGHEWIDACRGDGKTSTPFSFSGPLTEAVLLGTIASNFKDERLQWDSQAMRFSNSADATAFVRRKYNSDRDIEDLLRL